MIVELRLTPEEAQHAKNVHGWVDPSYPKSTQWPNEVRFLLVGNEAEEVMAMLANHNKQQITTEIQRP